METPPIQLCNRCQTFDFNEWFYPVIDVETGDFGDYSRLSEDLTFDVREVSKTQRDCTFCALLMAALSLNPQFTGRLRNNTQMTVSIFINRVGTVTWSPRTNHTSESPNSTSLGWRRVDDSHVRIVRHLSITARQADYKPVGGVAVFPICASDTTGRDRLLHYTNAPRSVVDLNMIHSWLSNCQEYHTRHCSQPSWSSMVEAGLSMVDVERYCVVPIRTVVDYLALSYCWGKPLQIRPTLLFTRATEPFLSRPGYLQEMLNRLPVTLQHAIELTQSLGRKYLWIDALCIPQDDDRAKSIQLGQMHKIYSHASIVIVAAAGIDASSGLPGLKEGLRSPRSFTQSLGRFEVLATHPQQHFTWSIRDSEWANRGWTLQEHICSTRRLIFTENEVIWDCASETLSEGRAPESAYAFPDTEVQHIQETGIGLKVKVSASSLQKFNDYMAGASSRKLGYESDRLDCVKGLFNSLEAQFPGGFFWGHPVDILDCSLLFHCGIYGKAPFERRPEFPSWSWAGHKTHARSTIAGPYDAGFSDTNHNDFDIPAMQTDTAWIRKITAFFHIDVSTNHWCEIPTPLIAKTETTMYDDSLTYWNTADSQKLLEDTIFSAQQANIPLTQILACWVQRAYLRVDRIEASKIKDRTEYNPDLRGFGDRSSGSGNGYAVRGPQGQDFGYLAVTEEYRQQHDDKMLFVALVEHWRWKDDLGPILQLIHVEQRDGLTVRVQIVRDCMAGLELWKLSGAEWSFVAFA